MFLRVVDTSNELHFHNRTLLSTISFRLGSDSMRDGLSTRKFGAENAKGHDLVAQTIRLYCLTAFLANFGTFLHVLMLRDVLANLLCWVAATCATTFLTMNIFANRFRRQPNLDNFALLNAMVRASLVWAWLRERNFDSFNGALLESPAAPLNFAEATWLLLLVNHRRRRAMQD